MGGIEPAFDRPDSLLFQFFLHEGDHLPGVGEVVFECTIYVAKATIGRAFGAIFFGASLARVFVERHAAGLAEVIETSHG